MQPGSRIAQIQATLRTDTVYCATNFLINDMSFPVFALFAGPGKHTKSRSCHCIRTALYGSARATVADPRRSRPRVHVADGRIPMSCPYFHLVLGVLWKIDSGGTQNPSFSETGIA